MALFSCRAPTNLMPRPSSVTAKTAVSSLMSPNTTRTPSAWTSSARAWNTGTIRLSCIAVLASGWGFNSGCHGSILSREIPLRPSGRPQMSAHQTPEEIRKSLTHPVIDGDGHWVEYTPVFAEKIRKVTGDLGANGFLQSQRRGPDSLGMTPEQRAERGVAMEGFWGRRSTNTRDRAPAMMPRMLYDRLDHLGIH